MNSFYYAMSLALTLYDIDMSEDMFEEIALTGWNLIGNKHTRTYKYSVCMDSCSDNTIDLPCNCDIIESVTTNWEDYNHTEVNSIRHFETEQYIELGKVFHDPLYLSGKLIKYERVGDTLYLDRHYNKINILYRGIVLDDNGLPELTDKEALALATYCAYIIKFKEGIKTNNGNIISIAETLKQRWYIQCDLARTDQYLSLNEWNDVLDAKTNWDRKIFRKSFKLYK